WPGSRGSALKSVDVFDRDGAAVAIENDEDGEADRGFRRGDREDQECKHLAREVIELGRERHEVDVDGEQDQLDRHQDDDDVLAVEENAENAQREQDRGNRQIMSETDGHSPCPDLTLTISIAVALERAT